MEKKLTDKELEEQEIANQIQKAIFEYDLKRGNGVTLEKSQFIGDRQRELEKQLSELKSPKSEQ